MPKGDKSKYTAKQKREAEHIEESYEQRGIDPQEAERRAWATVNKMHGGGAKGGSGAEDIKDPSPAQKGGRKGSKSSKKRTKKQQP
jgi:plasmid stabilization system protein ParE